MKKHEFGHVLPQLVAAMRICHLHAHAHKPPMIHHHAPHGVLLRTTMIFVFFNLKFHTLSNCPCHEATLNPGPPSPPNISHRAHLLHLSTFVSSFFGHMFVLGNIFCLACGLFKNTKLVRHVSIFHILPPSRTPVYTHLGTSLHGTFIS